MSFKRKQSSAAPASARIAPQSKRSRETEDAKGEAERVEEVGLSTDECLAHTLWRECLLPALQSRDFFAKYWERESLHLSGVFSAAQLRSFAVEFEDLVKLSRRHPLFYEYHVNACKYTDGEKVMLNPVSDNEDESDESDEMNDDEEEAAIGEDDERTPASGEQDDQDPNDEEQDENDIDEEGLENDVDDVDDAHLYGATFDDGMEAPPTVVPAYPVTEASLRQLWTSGATFQYHQPQHHSNALYRMMADMERFFSCLVGCNVYLTPSGCQGLAPHHDNIEAIVIQVSGRKHWRLYKPLEELASSYSEDLEQDQIGEPILDVVLEAGDVLYFPRGVIHQAVAQEDSSVHVTLSTYESWNYGSLLSSCMSSCVEQAIPKSLDLRRGLPRTLLNGGSEGVRVAATEISRLLSSQEVQEAMLSELQSSMREFALDFLYSRLPPPPITHQSKHPFGASRAKYVFRDAGYVRLEVGPGPDDEDEVFAILYHCTRNPRTRHMLSLGDVRLVPCTGVEVAVDAQELQSSTVTPKKDEAVEPEVEEDEDDDEDDDEQDDDAEGPGVLHYPLNYEPGLRFMIEHAGHPVSAGELASAMPELSLEDAHNLLFGLVNEKLVVVQ